MAVNEARRCLQCTSAECNQGCPAGVDVRRFVGAIATGDFIGAMKTLYEKNILPLSCAYICPVGKQCIERCRHTELNYPITINRLQEWLTRYAIEQKLYFPRPATENGRRVAVVGAGPSGLAAAMKLRLNGFRVTVFERSESLGGMLRHCVPPFRLPREALDLEIEIIRSTGIEFRTGAPVTDARALLKEGFEAVYLATGLWKSAGLNLETQPGKGVYEALPFLSDCAAGDGAAAKYDLAGKRVVVIGGGSVAADVSAHAVRLGARSVTLAMLESPAEMPAAPDEIDRAWADGVLFECRMLPLELAREGGRLKALKAVHIEWKQPGLIHPSNAIQIAGSEFALPADVIFYAIGQRPDAETQKLIEPLEKARALPKVDEKTMGASQPGLFAGGDLVTGGGSAAKAIADGMRAAEGMMAYLRSTPRKG